MELATSASSARLSSTLADILDDFNAIAPNERDQLLLEPTTQCQSPIFLAVEVGGTGELAEILPEGPNGLTAADVPAMPDDAARLSPTG